MENQNKNNNNWVESLAKAYQELSIYLGLGIQLAVTMVLMFFLGKYLDDKFDTKPFLTIGFSLFGGFAGIYNFFNSVKNLNKKKESSQNAEK